VVTGIDWNHGILYNFMTFHNFWEESSQLTQIFRRGSIPPTSTSSHFSIPSHQVRIKTLGRNWLFRYVRFFPRNDPDPFSEIPPKNVHMHTYTHMYIYIYLCGAPKPCCAVVRFSSEYLSLWPWGCLKIGLTPPNGKFDDKLSSSTGWSGAPYFHLNASWNLVTSVFGFELDGSFMLGCCLCPPNPWDHGEDVPDFFHPVLSSR
jgi:hypothetical protein